MNKDKFKLLWSLTKNYRIYFIIGLLSIVISSVFNFIAPLIISATVDSILGEPQLSIPTFFMNNVNNLGGTSFIIRNLWICAVAYVVLLMFRSLFLFLRGKYMAKASDSVAKCMKDKVYYHLQKVSYNYHVSSKTGDLIQRCTTDIETTRNFMANRLSETLRLITMLIIALGILLPINSKLTIMSVMLMPLLIVISTIYFKKVQAQFAKVEEADGHMSTVLQESLTGVRVVRAFGRQVFERKKFVEAVGDFKKKNLVLTRYFAIFYGGSDLLVMGQMLITILFGIVAAVNGDITVGQFLIFIAYVRMMLWPIRDFGRTLAEMGKTSIALGRIQEILLEPVETSGDNPQKPPINRDIIFKNVSFSYDEHEVLKGLNMEVKQGETVAILGATGSGKSSLVQLLQRLYDYQEGSITIGGIELKNIDKDYLRKRISIVLQEPFLYSRTVKQNIGITQVQEEDEAIFEAARMAHVHDNIHEFEKGYDTIVGERGVTLSGGQKQRIAIARTILRDSDVLIFDDSLSAVDTQTDSLIRKELKEHHKSITTFIISHRISTLMEADKIVVIQDGHIAQQGSHDELIKQKGLYSRIWNIQSSTKMNED